MRRPWNKKEISNDKKRVLRNLFFQKQSISTIEKLTGLTRRVIYRHIGENGWISKRERYWKYIIYVAYKNKKSMEYICKKCGIKSINILRRIKQKYNIKTQRFDMPNKILTREIEQKIISDYKELISSTDVAHKYGFKTHKTVIDVLNKNDIKVREPKKITYYNMNYFKKIDSHDKAYILGLLITDGYVIREYSGIGIQLTECDKYLLLNIKDRLGPSTTVIDIDCSNKRKKHKNKNNINFKNSKDMVRLGCYCPQISRDLRKMGIIRNKTYELKSSPEISITYLSSYFRGLWDGDGTIGIAKNGNIWCNLVCYSKSFLESLTRFDIPFKFKIYNPVKGRSVAAMRISGGNSETIKFLKWMYRNKSNLYLERKYAKVQDKISK